MENEFFISQINSLRLSKNAVIMAHYYQIPEIQDIADFVGDSLALAQEAEKTTADIIVLCGVHFMGETAKILNPQKKVIIPDANAGCSLAESCPAHEFKKFIKQYPDYKVVTYVNTTAAVKALSDITVTSTNAKKIIESLPQDEKIIFGPDKNLGDYINSQTGRQMLLWDGACHVHEQFSLEKLLKLKSQFPNAEIIAHPECKKPVLMVADFIGSTAALLNYSAKSKKNTFIVATESGILHQMQKKSPDKTFIPVPPDDSTCACNECNFMRLNTLKKLYECLRTEKPEIIIDEAIRAKAVKPIKRMLKMSAKLIK
ncbi:MAG: quinolinate synthase NadA [Prevotellaceae bacterium]|jgi:quinolinate synthase|nr:quinolinate synthase NadA [Prevotellaceae bacterium]